MSWGRKSCGLWPGWPWNKWQNMVGLEKHFEHIEARRPWEIWRGGVERGEMRIFPTTEQMTRATPTRKNEGNEAVVLNILDVKKSPAKKWYKSLKFKTEATAGNSSSGAVGIKIRKALRRDEVIDGVYTCRCKDFSHLTLWSSSRELGGSEK